MTISRSECPLCGLVGKARYDHYVTCRAYRAFVHMEHCRQCSYHRTECSIDWCSYRTKEQKIKDKLK